MVLIFFDLSGGDTPSIQRANGMQLVSLLVLAIGLASTESAVAAPQPAGAPPFDWNTITWATSVADTLHPIRPRVLPPTPGVPHMWYAKYCGAPNLPKNGGSCASFTYFQSATFCHTVDPKFGPIRSWSTVGSDCKIFLSNNCSGKSTAIPAGLDLSDIDPAMRGIKSWQCATPKDFKYKPPPTP
ncbi:hypothetical protein HGRIS_003186 [Hohenbuehelia grisea]|uniref:Secreted protein n=1 Tax=Hohenbuehelia grisea TaxID=104357 RepID=A0ABR3JMY6_9AGAR